jgi:hypothetical protein
VRRAATRSLRLAGAASGAYLVTACASTAPRVAAPPGPTPAEQQAAADAAHVRDFLSCEAEALAWVAASDPRLARRAGGPAPAAVLDRIGTDAVLAEDPTAQVRDGALDVFAFRARARALDTAGRRVAAFTERLPDAVAPGDGSSLARPNLERELLGRLIAEERARADDESHLDSAAGDLVRAMVETWTPPASPEEWPGRDRWAAERLVAIRDALRDGHAWTGPLDLDAALYPLERLLAPQQFPRAAAALAQVRVAIDDARGVPARLAPERLDRQARVHLGVAIDPATVLPRLARLEDSLRGLADGAVRSGTAPAATVAARARELLLRDAACPAVPATRVRAMAPPPERAAVCGALDLLQSESPAVALTTLHDDVVFAFSAVTDAPPPRTRMLSAPDNDTVDDLRRRAREHPVAVLAVAVAAELLYAPGTVGADDRLRAWRALGEAPLDVVARELGGEALTERTGSPGRE